MTVKMTRLLNHLLKLPEMISVLEARKKSLQEEKNKILEIKDESVKGILLDLVKMGGR